MAKPKKPSSITANKLTEAIRCLALICKDEGAPHETHILLQNKTATAFNGTLAAGALIEDDIQAAPHAKTFLNALQKCTEGYTITQLDEAKLSIKSGKFKAIVPCINPNLLPFPIPDSPATGIGEPFRSALSIIDKIKIENGQHVHLLSFLLNGPSLIATDGKIIIEAWHGLDLPPGLPIPLTLIPSIMGNPKRLFSFGFSPSSVTFYFDDNSWVRSQLYAQPWPNVMHILERKSSPVAIPTDFYKGLETIIPFGEGTVYFDTNLLRSHRDDGKGAVFELMGLNKGPVFTIKYLMMIKDIATKIDFYNDKMLAFTGPNIRGMIAGHG